jgi:ribonucleoside-diphosphate reductase alpha chain
MAARERLPDRRHSETFNLEIGGLHYVATVSWFADGRPGEVFLNAGWQGRIEPRRCGTRRRHNR